TTEFSDMFCALNGATLTPRRASQRQIPAVTALLPASDAVPATSSPFTASAPQRRRPAALSRRPPPSVPAHPPLHPLPPPAPPTRAPSTASAPPSPRPGPPPRRPPPSARAQRPFQGAPPPVPATSSPFMPPRRSPRGQPPVHAAAIRDECDNHRHRT